MITPSLARLQGVAVAAAACIGVYLFVSVGGTYMDYRHDTRLVAIYCGDHRHCADHVKADYVRKGRTPWAREAMRIQDAEDQAYDDAERPY